jgi:hypothetical protein
MVAVADAPAIGWVMKHEDNRPKAGKPEAGSGESLHELYQELLCLRVEVRSAELRSFQMAGRSQKLPRRVD